MVVVGMGLPDPSAEPLAKDSPRWLLSVSREGDILCDLMHCEKNNCKWKSESICAEGTRLSGASRSYLKWG